MEGRTKPIFFRSGAELRRWLERHHSTERELLVGFYKKGAPRAGITYREALDEALCFGWIDGVRRSVDDDSYMNRFTPRTARSTWSVVNIGRMRELIADGQVAPAGLAAFERRDEERSRQYSYEARTRPLDPEYERELRANARAWAFFSAQPPSYRRLTSWWVMSAKQEATRRRRLATLVDCSAAGARIPQLASPARKTTPRSE
jgi:uncharacterized protein YdeI (YjbR/CyaY-like superfamily)